MQFSIGKTLVVQLLRTLVKLVAGILIAYVLLRLLPGSPFDDETLGQLTEVQRHQLNLEGESFFGQLFSWLLKTLKVEFYSSYFDRPDVIKMQLSAALYSTFLMSLVTISFSNVLSTFLILIRSRTKGRLLYLFNLISDIVLSVPVYIYLGLGLSVLVLIKEIYHTDVRNLFMALGITALFFRQSFFLADLINQKIESLKRTSLDQSLGAKGLSQSQIYLSHYGRMALSPTLGALAPWLAQLFVGQLSVEYILGWNGIGRYLLQSYQSRDFPLAMSLTLWLCIIYFFIEYVLSVIRIYLDPRLGTSEP